MTKKHFIALADMIKAHNADTLAPFGGYAEMSVTSFTHGQCVSLAAFCTAQNPRFNANRWMSYINGECGPNGGKVKP